MAEVALDFSLSHPPTRINSRLKANDRADRIVLVKLASLSKGHCLLQ
jgi:hypothetical protein